MQKKKVHFMGIGGSGMSAVASLAFRFGYKVTGCDIQKDTPYISNLKKMNIPIYTGHNANHLKGVEILAVTPAAFYRKEKCKEFTIAQNTGKLMTWQKFLGKYIQKGKETICISGTHGKSTTTAMASCVFEKAGKDPSVMVGAKVRIWNTNYRYGKGKIFITESDEFFDNFLNYSPDTIILNNVELDHFDFFKSKKQLIESFRKHIKKLKSSKTLIINQDSPLILNVLNRIDKQFFNSLNIIGYTIKKNPEIKSDKSVYARITKRTKKYTQFYIDNDELKIKDTFKIGMTGDFNVSNALGVIILSKLKGIPTEKIKSSLENFKGIGRRMELIGVKKERYVYDDYAHHPTAINLTLKALRQKHPKAKIWTIVEPHSYSRTKGLLNEYVCVFDNVDEVIITSIYKARDTKTFGINASSIVNVAKHKNIYHLDSFEKIANKIKKESRKKDVIIVMGAGNSHLLAKQIYESI